MELHDNDVYIYVHHSKVLSVNETEHSAERQPYDARKLTVTFPEVAGSNYNCTKGQISSEHPPGPFLLPWDPEKPNRIGIRFHAGRHQKKYVAMDYMNQGHIDPNLARPDPGANDDTSWPETGISLNQSTMRSASMSAKGDHEAPHKLNFYFRVRIATESGFVLNLLVAQSGPASGFLKRLYHIGKAVADGVKAGLEAYEGDEEEALEDTQSFLKDIKTIAGENHNPWYVTVLGDTNWPASAVDKHSFLSTVLKKKVVKNSLVYTAPVGTANPPKNIQSARFYYYSEEPPKEHSYYTFNLILYDEKPFKGVLPEDRSDTEILFLDESERLYRHNLDETEKHEVAHGVPYWCNLDTSANIVAQGDVCCYFSDFNRDTLNPKSRMMIRYRGNSGWQEQKFDGVVGNPVIHEGKVYFSKDDRMDPMGIYCFDPSSSPPKASLLIKGFTTPQASDRRPTHLAIRPGTDELYYLGGGGPAWQEQGYHLHRWDISKGVHTVIRRPAPRDKDVGSMDDTKFVFCKDYIYYSDRMKLFRTRADGTGEAQRITFNSQQNDDNNDLAAKQPIFASPNGEYVFYKGWWEGTIFKVSTSDPSKVTPILTKCGSEAIQAVSDELIFLDHSTIDFNGNRYDNLRRRTTSSSPDQNDHREVKLSDPVAHPVVLGREVFGTIGKERGSYQLVRGEIPELKTITEDTRIKFRYVADGLRVASARSVQ